MLSGYNVVIMLIPIQPIQGALALSNPDTTEELTLQQLGSTEAHLEEFVRKNIDKLFPDDETLLIVGQQVRNQQGGRCDLVAIDGDGNIVLFELKRDPGDSVARKEAFEFQAIRYAATFAGITNTQALVQDLFEPYVRKHLSEFRSSYPVLSEAEIASRVIPDFLKDTEATKNFNRRQRIVLIASSFDLQTLSACAWLVKGGIDIRCISVKPAKYADQHFLSVEQVIPPPLLEKFFVGVANSSQAAGKSLGTSPSITRQTLPKMLELLKWGLINPGDKVYIKNRIAEVATVKDDKQVTYQDQDLKDQDLTFNAWAQKVTTWPSVNVYDMVVDVKTNKTLGTLRQEKLQELDKEVSTNGDLEIAL